jgi:hypothetical protein
MTRKNELAPREDQATELASADEPPVVARLVVEIRSDGSRTVARSSLEDAQLGERTSLEVKGATPSELVFSMMKALFHRPAFASSVAQALLAGRTKDDTDENQEAAGESISGGPRWSDYERQGRKAPKN